jgi:hypothetical protein
MRQVHHNNNRKGHSARLFEYRYVENPTDYGEEMLRNEKIAILRYQCIFCVFDFIIHIFF